MAWFRASMNIAISRRLCLILLFSMLLGGCASTPAFNADAVQARIVSMAAWGGTAPVAEQAAAARQHVPDRITLHHGGETFPRSRDPRDYLRRLQSWSRSDRKWIDVPYHYLIDLDGNIYEGRDIRFAGDTNTEYDPAGHALVVVLGNYEEIEPAPAQLTAVSDVMALLARKYAIDPARIAAHKDFASTLCPGKNLYPYVREGYFREEVRRRIGP